MKKKKENELLQRALEALRKNLPGHAEIKNIKPLRAPRLRADYVLKDGSGLYHENGKEVFLVLPLWFE